MIDAIRNAPRPLTLSLETTAWIRQSMGKQRERGVTAVADWLGQKGLGGPAAVRTGRAAIKPHPIPIYMEHFYRDRK